MRRLILLGCTHTGATLDEIARARVPLADREGSLRTIREQLGASELVYLETCHRTEYYIAYKGELCPGRLTLLLMRILSDLTNGASQLPEVEHCLGLQGEKAARHLFRVASGLDAMMIGESQVLGQVKSAFREASDAGLAGPILQTLFEQSFRASKRVRTETALSRRPVSLVSLAERSLRHALASSSEPVAVLGAGEMATLAAQMMRKIDADRGLLVFNRGAERGQALARALNGEFVPMEQFKAVRRPFAAIVAATSAPTAVITSDLALDLAPTTVLDLGLPANVAPEVATIPGITLVGQQELSGEAEANRAARAEEVTAAERILDEQLEELAYEMMESYLSPVARKLVAAFREVARGELETLYASGGDGNGGLDAALDRLSQRLVRLPMRGLREVAWTHSPDVLSTFLDAVDR